MVWRMGIRCCGSIGRAASYLERVGELLGLRPNSYSTSHRARLPRCLCKASSVSAFGNLIANLRDGSDCALCDFRRSYCRKANLHKSTGELVDDEVTKVSCQVVGSSIGARAKDAQAHSLLRTP